MKTFVPDYYKKFKCVAGRCRHSCCIGWEIDIDSDSLNNYRSISGTFGARLQKSITQTDGTHHFELCKNERCPFLNSENLCDIIINLGEDALCQICTDHPRFRNFLSDRTEIGLGLCCEAAAELILSNKQRSQLQCISDDSDDEITDEDAYFLNIRQRYVDILQKRNLPLEERFNTLLSEADSKADSKSVAEWAEIYLSLEHLDSEWVQMLKKLKNKGGIQLFLTPEWEISLEQLAVYFVIRHLADGRFDMSIPERISFAVHATGFISTVTSLCCENCDINSLVNTARMYSSEIEYSEENLSTLLDILLE